MTQPPPEAPSAPPWPSIAVSLLLAILTVTAFYPGAMSADSLLQFAEAWNGVFVDDHPPIMAGLWRLLLDLWPHLGVLFLAHVLGYWSLWCALSLAATRTLAGRMMILAIACLPPLWSQDAVVWKDTELSITLLGAYLCVFSIAQPGKGKGWSGRKGALLAVGLLLFLYAAAVRKNAAPLLLPLAFYSTFCVFPKVSQLRAALLAVLLVGGSFLLTLVLNDRCFHAKKAYSFQVIEAFDIAGVFHQTQRMDLIPEYWKTLNSGLTPEALLAGYNPASRNDLFVGQGAPLKTTTDPGFLSQLREKWLYAIRLFPLPYLYHRWNSFRILLGLGEKESYYPLQLTIVPNPMGIQSESDPGLMAGLSAYFLFFKDSFLFRGWFYVLALFAVLVYHSRRISLSSFLRNPSVCSALSGLLYTASFFFGAPSSDFRYLYPVVFLVSFSAILIVREECAKRGKAW